MAIIGKIRNNSWFILILLALALAAFLLMDVMGSNSVFGGAASQLNMGKVAGQKIEYTEFQKTEQALYSGSGDVYARRSSLWTYLVEKAIITKEAEALGLGVSDDEMAELQFGSKLSPIIQNNFKNPQTGQVDRQRLQQIKQFMDSGEEMDPQFKLFWDEQAKQIEKTRIQDKYQSMVAKGLYTPTWQAEVLNQFNSENASINYVKIPFDNVADADVTVTDEDIKKYVSNNAGKYTNDEETRIIDYVIFNVLPTAADTLVWRDEISELVPEFQGTNEDSLFALNNGGFYSFLYSKKDELQGAIKDNVETMNVGDTYGPYVHNGAYFVGKLLGQRVVPDSVKARHILRNVVAGDAASLASARSYIDSLKTRLTSGAESFDSLAIKNSEDTGSGFKGGDLGYFTQGAMVPAFNNACFIGSTEGGLYTVKTQFGIHLIEVTDLIFNNQDNKYNVAYIRTPIIPTQGTQEKIEDLAGDLIGKNTGVSGFAEAVKGMPNVVINSSKELKINDYYINTDLENGETTRDIIKWAFGRDTEVGEVSPIIYSYTDLVNYFDSKYVIAGLKAVYEPGLKNIDVVRNNVELIVRNEKKGELLKSKITGNDIDAVASQYSTIVVPADNLNFNSGYIPDLGPEPKVVAAVFKANTGDVAGPIVGNSGVFMVKVNAKTPANASANVVDLKRSTNSSIRGQVGFRLMNALKKIYKPEDKRSKFF
jgi:peptidyl-prolyl cis-trans isomerase D